MQLNTNAVTADAAARPSDQVLYTVEQLSRAEPALTPGMLRWALFNRKENGLEKSGAVVQIGRRVLFHRPKFMEWAAGQTQTS